MSEAVNLRAIILDILMEVNENGMYSHLTINNALKKYQYLEKADRSFITKISNGTIEKMIYIDYVIDSFSKVPVKKMKPLIRNLMRMSVYQILFMDKVPDSAACNEAVKIATKRGFSTLKGFVNGVLRNISRNKAEIKMPDSLSVKYSIPQWIIDKWQKEYGQEKLVKILEAFERENPTYVRLNTSISSSQEIIASLNDQNVKTKGISGVEDAVEISEYDFIAGLNAYNDGLINVQDVSSMLVGIVAQPKKDDYVIDVCAAPGGKSVHVAVLMEQTGCVDSRDISENKVFLMEQNMQRMRLENVKTTVSDAMILREDDIEKADIVLADLPCSGLGIIGRKADIKYKMTSEKQAELVKIQREILKVVSQYVKKGGKLIFSTCTINKDENEENVKWIEENLGLVPDSIEEIIPNEYLVDEYSKETAKAGYIQLLPGIHNTDGFFISRFVKK